MLDAENNKYEEKTLSRELVFHGSIFRVVHDTVSLPDGKIGKRELVFHNGGVAVAPILNNQLILVGQYRKALEQFIYEIPAGKLEFGEKMIPEIAALRELEEETGYTISQGKQLETIAPFYGTPGFSSEKTYLYFTDQLRKVDHPRPMDEEEFLEVKKVSLNEAKKMIEVGEICDAKTIMAVQFWELKKLRGDLINAKTDSNR
ncbi:NUDIX hydrolase [Lactococcus fujiensis]|uniref:ADP-ribose pyrophosphatase n=1 Tax=Lactococcus fujiensis JCM 16395 TaxID=1291764 RepID=A0A2A5RMC2_9LACT|nr:NUDIX hydrolase [Lactococcus fujiensis]PCS00471.1 ADP-ribose pyrophosphatase [Lactococcus fujiensis JCM 16395]